MKIVNAKKIVPNPTLNEVVATNNDLKNFLVEYTGEKINPEDQNVTVEMIVEVMAKEFPEFLLAVAEENWVRGYQQAIEDVDNGIKMEKEKTNEQKRSCKLCQEPE
tara:strand:- start:321 stop:638 length:318 start_codon:yes stop_codon:yes gene_type:complete